MLVFLYNVLKNYFFDLNNFKSKGIIYSYLENEMLFRKYLLGLMNN